MSNNAADGFSGGFGGGIDNSGTLTLIDSTVSGNSAKSGGGGILNRFGNTLTLTNSTVSGNSVPAGGSGGGILSQGTVTLTNTTLSDNSAPAGTFTGSNLTTDSPGTVTLKNTIVANPKGGGANCVGSTTSQGNNLSSDGSCGFTGTGDIQNQNPKLGALDFYGGPTKTHALLAGSPAIDTGTNTGCPATDQRGTSRPQDGDENGTPVCDIGAFEQDDVVQPTVNSVSPLEDKTRVRRGMNITATFSEKMDRTTLTKDTVTLVNTKTGAKVEDVAVSCDAECLTVTLNPAAPLAKKTKYEVAITTDTKDRAGNALDQDTVNTGDQPKVWSFTTGIRK